VFLLPRAAFILARSAAALASSRMTSVSKLRELESNQRPLATNLRSVPGARRHYQQQLSRNVLSSMTRGCLAWFG
jgi:hypothetical protein